MATITTTTRPLDDTIEEFEVRFRIRPERDPHLDESGAPVPANKRKKPKDRYEVRVEGVVEFSNSDKREKVVLPWEKLNKNKFPEFTPGDLNKLRDLLAKLHVHFAAETV